MELIERISDLADNIAGSKGMELVDVEMFRAGRRSILRVFVGKKDGVSIQDCTEMSRELSARLDAENLIEEAYTLEVSSPGLDRPFKTRRDWERNVGREVRVSCREPVQGKSQFTGELESVSDSGILLRVKGSEVPIPFEMVALGKLEIKF